MILIITNAGGESSQSFHFNKDIIEQSEVRILYRHLDCDIYFDVITPV